MAKKVVTNDGKKGGWLVGKRHYDKNGNSLGGIKAVVTDAGDKPVELEGGEVIINREASKKYWKELSRINQSAGNGVPIEPPAGAFDEDPSEEYEKGGKIEFNANHIPNKWILNYAIKIKAEHKDVWDLGGNIFGNQAFINLKRVAERGYWLDSEEWMYKKWRSYVARHQGDFRIEGVIAMLKWVDKVDKGWQYMKNLIEEEIKKREARNSKKMKDGGNVENKGIFHNLKKKIARGVLDDSYDLVKSKTDKRAISRAEKIIRDRYNDGGNVDGSNILTVSKYILNRHPKNGDVLRGGKYQDYEIVSIKKLSKADKISFKLWLKKGINRRIVTYTPQTKKISDFIKVQKGYAKGFRYETWDPEPIGGKMRNGGSVGNVVKKGYHGTQKKSPSEIKPTSGRYGFGIYLTPDYKTAEYFGKQGFVNGFRQLDVYSNANVYEYDLSNLKIQKLQSSDEIDNLDKATNYDGIYLEDEGEIIIYNTNKLKDGKLKTKMRNGGNLSKTPAPLSERIKGSKTNAKGTAKDSTSGEDIKFDDKTIASIQSLIDAHNEKYPSKKITLGVAKAVVRRGMGAYSSSHRPTITGGKPNSRTAWGLARLKAFIHKAEKGKSKSGKYSQDNDLFDDLDIKVSMFATGGLIAPNGKPSNLTPEQYDLVRTPEFKAWFGDWENDPKNASKVVDENGEPLVVYRGDSSASKKGFVFKTGFNRMGFINKSRLPNQYFHYFVNNYDVALGYANDQIQDHNEKVEETGKGKLWESKVTPYFLNIKNPIDITPNNPLFPSFKEYENVLKNQEGKEWYEKNSKFRAGYDYGKEISSAELNKIFEDKLGKNYLDNTEYSNLSNWQREGFQNYTGREQSYSFFIELKDSYTRSIILRKVYENMLKNNIDGLIFIETTHWDSDFIENWNKYKSGELKYDYKRWVEKPKVFAALESNQIKLADGTNTTFDVDNPDIRFAQGGGIGKSKDIPVHIDYLEQQLFENNKDIEVPKSVYKEYTKSGKVPKDIVDDLSSEIDEKNWVETNPLSVHLTPINKMNNGGNVDAQDSVTIDIPLIIRLLELSREDIKSDAELHFVVERLLKLKNKPVLTMDDYAFIADVEHNHLKKYDLGGKMPEGDRMVDLGFGGLGNGTTVWDRNRIHNNDYKIVAHISNEGKITYYDKKLPEYAINQIESMAENEKKRYEDMNGLSTGYDFNPIQTPLN